MITYKGQQTVIGKRFFYEGQTVKYKGKIYGDKHLFLAGGIEYILDESDLLKLNEYNINGEDTNTIKDIDTKDILKNVILNYTEKQLNIINDILNNKDKDISKLNNLYKEEFEKLKFLNKYSLPKDRQTDISLEAQKSYLENVNRNISGVNLVTLLVSLLNFIASNKED